MSLVRVYQYLGQYKEKFFTQWQQLGLDAMICPAFPTPAFPAEEVFPNERKKSFLSQIKFSLVISGFIGDGIL